MIIKIVSRNRCRTTGKHWHQPIRCTLREIRLRHYQKGNRPKPGTLLFSPSLDIVFGWDDALKKEQSRGTA